MSRDGAASGAVFVDLASHILLFYWAWAVLTPVVLHFTPANVSHNTRGWLRFLGASAAILVLHAVLYLALVRMSGIDAHVIVGVRALQDYARRHTGGDLATLGMIAGIGVLLNANRRARQRDVAAAELETRLARADLELLRWQLHPHFLFNALNTVSTLVLRGATADADEAISRISRYLRSALEQRADSVVTVAEELAVVMQYVSIESIRFGDALRVESAISAQALAARVPGLILQPLVENAIRHGNTRGPIVIAGELRGDRLRLTVTNTGEDADIVAEGFGLGYVRQRLEQFHGAHATLQRSNEHGTVVVTLDLPGHTA